MAHHREAERRRLERLGLGVRRAAAAPPPRAVDERSVRRVHEPDHRVIDRRLEPGGLDQCRAARADVGQLRDVRRGFGVLTEEHPDVALQLARRIALDLDAPGLEGLAVDQRRDRGAAALGIEAPAVIAALDLAPVEPALGQRHAAMRADVTQREHAAVGRPADQQRLAQDGLGQRAAARQLAAGQGVVPDLAQRRRAVCVQDGNPLLRRGGYRGPPGALPAAAGRRTKGPAGGGTPGWALNPPVITENSPALWFYRSVVGRADRCEQAAVRSWVRGQGYVGL